MYVISRPENGLKRHTSRLLAACINIQYRNKYLTKLYIFEVIPNLSQQITVRREGLARHKPLRAGRFGLQFYSEKFTHLEVLYVLDWESKHVSLTVEFFITILSK